MKPCPLCMSLRAKFVRWLGVRLGVMEPIKEKPMEQDPTQMTQGEVLALIGKLTIDIAARDKIIALQQQRIAQLSPPEPEKKPDLEIVK